MRCAALLLLAALVTLTVCMLYDTYLVPAQNESILLFRHVTLITVFFLFVALLVVLHAVCG